MSSSICVVGSVNMDLVVEAPHFPEPGETVAGSVFHAYPGGKGANQAVATARLGAHTHLVGSVGDDAWGSELRAAFAAEGVDTHGLVTVPDRMTGSAFVTVVPGGENAIITAPGANDAVTPEQVEANERFIAEADMLLVQLEIPMPAVERAVQLARSVNTPVVLNAAPARELPPELLDGIAVLVANEGEARALAGCEPDVGPVGLARRLRARGPGLVVVTVGRNGAVCFDGETKLEQGAFPADCVDTTGAGDAFVGALAVGLAEGQRNAAVLRFACAAGSLCTAAHGAIPSLPSRQALDELLAGEKASEAGRG